jgi:hypothetical protein
VRHEDALRRLPELVGLRAAGADDAELSDHVADCGRCRESLRRLQEIDSGLRSLDAPPPSSQRLERRVLAIPAAGAPERRRRIGRRMAVTAASAILLVGAAIGVVVSARDDPARGPEFAAERIVRLVTPEPRAVSAQVEIGAPEGSRIPMRIVATGLPHGGGRFYGLWLTGADGAVSGGSFRPDGEGRCVVMLQVPAGAWTAVNITAGNRPPSPRTTVARAAL